MSARTNCLYFQQNSATNTAICQANWFFDANSASDAVDVSSWRKRNSSIVQEQEILSCSNHPFLRLARFVLISPPLGKWITLVGARYRIAGFYQRSNFSGLDLVEHWISSDSSSLHHFPIQRNVTKLLFPSKWPFLNFGRVPICWVCVVGSITYVSLSCSCIVSSHRVQLYFYLYLLPVPESMFLHCLWPEKGAGKGQEANPFVVSPPTPSQTDTHSDRNATHKFK